MTSNLLRRSRLALLYLAFAYLAVEALYVARLPLVMDEFQGAHAVWRLLGELPYRDFVPYKTVLGYYLQLPALVLSGDPWTALLTAKLWMAILCAVTLAAGALRLTRSYAPLAAPLALGATFVMSDFLERSADLRVDAATALVAFLGLLALLERRWLLAGALSGCAFLVSQKAAYAILAGLVGIACDAINRRDRRAFSALARFGASSGGVVGTYAALWSLAAAPETVLRATFLAHGRIAFADLYPGIRQEFWSQTLMRNPGFWVLALVAVLALAARARSAPDDARQPALLAGYGATMLALGIWHRQPWPYFFVLLVPTVLVLHAALVDLMLSGWAAVSSGRRRLFGASLAIFVYAWPLLRLPANFARDSRAQRMNVRLGEAILPADDSYLAGLDLLWRRQQFPVGLAWLDQVRLHELHSAPEGEIERLIGELRREPPRLLVVGSRIQVLPKPLLALLGERYQPLYGNLFGFAPLILPSGGRLDWPFDGKFEALLASPGRVSLDGREIRSGEVLSLRAGPLEIVTEVPLRLAWRPSLPMELLDPRFGSPTELFPNVYSY